MSGDNAPVLPTDTQKNTVYAFAKEDDVEVTVVDRTNHHLFQPLLYQVAAGILSPGLIAPPSIEPIRMPGRSPPP